MNGYQSTPDLSKADDLRLEAVVTCVGFDDLLDYTLEANHPHFDSVIVVTTYDDRKTQQIAQKHGAFCVQTDLFQKNGRSFNKGAAVNAGFNRWQYNGWRMHLDADIALPDNFRRMLFNHTHLDKDCIYGADRVDVIGSKHIKNKRHLQHQNESFVVPRHQAPLSPRYVDKLYSYAPLGYFQLWHAKTHKPYPYSLGTAAHDDIAFSTLWPESHRRLLPSVIVDHLCPETPYLSQNWEGRKSQRID